MLYLIILLVSVVSTKKATNALIATDKFNNGVDLFNNCDKYSDCFNCTLSKCNWKAGTCQNFPGKTSPNVALSVGAFLV